MMYEHHTKSKGDLGVFKVQLDLYEKGHLILNPMTEHAPFDLVSYKDNKFYRVQVKYRKLMKGVLKVSFSNTHCNTKGAVTKKINKNEIDLFAVYCPETDLVYYFCPKQFKDNVSIRVEPLKNNRVKGINFATDFLNIPNAA